MAKRIWPIVLTILIYGSFIIEMRMICTTNDDPLGVEIVYSLILMPACSLIVCAWYGYLLKSKYKWGIAVLFGLLTLISMMIFVCMLGTEYDNIDISFLIQMLTISTFTGIIGTALGNLLKRFKNNR